MATTENTGTTPLNSGDDVVEITKGGGTHIGVTKQMSGASTLSTNVTRCWETCYYCPCETFNISADFVKYI